MFGKPTYAAADKRAMLANLKDVGVLKDDNAREFVRLRQNRGRLLKRPKKICSVKGNAHERTRNLIGSMLLLRCDHSRDRG